MDGFEGPRQTRAGGLTRAILDTFPVIKFSAGSTGSPQTGHSAVPVGTKEVGSTGDWENTEYSTPSHKFVDQFEMSPTPQVKRESGIASEHAMSRDVDTAAEPSSRPTSGGEFSRTSVAAPLSAGHSTKVEPTLDNIGTDICPICITDFEEGDDLRVLPCDGQHKFHRDCVDPWLLQVSSQCPLCRHGTFLWPNH